MMGMTITRLALGASLLALSCAAMPAYAQSAPGNTAAAARDFDISSQALGDALNLFARTADVQFAYSADIVAGRTGQAVRGRFTVGEALARLLAGTGLTWRYTNANTVVLERAAEGTGADGERVLGAVRVEGAQGSPFFGGAGKAAGVNGTNGSRDITATEGTRSFTSGALTIGSKAPQALKDVPQSISVLTSERLEQQNVTDYTSAMRQLPGITVVQGTSSLENKFYSRGFEVTSFQIDGGAPLTTAKGYFPQIDMSIYDHVEMLRGASGLLNGYGDPGGVVNLVRKKPLDHPQFILDAQAGSWSNYRVVADATSPLALDGKLRGRLVMTYQDNHHFYKLAKDNKSLIYGIVELDATPSTTLTAGVNYTHQNSLPWLNGLPRYSSGADLKLSRSTCLCFPWNRQNFDTTEFFGGVEQRIGNDWTLKVNLTKTRQRSDLKYGFNYLSVNPTNNLGPVMGGNYYNYGSDQLSTEAVLSGGFTLFGQRQEVTIGANRSRSDGHNDVHNGLIVSPYQPYPGGPIFDYGNANGSRPPINVFNFNPYDAIYSEPPNSLSFLRTPKDTQTQMGAYLNLRLTAFDRLHLTTGLRWSRFQADLITDLLCTQIPATDPGYTPSCFGKKIGDTFFNLSNTTWRNTNFSWPPPVSVSFDLTKNLTAYVGYTDIYISQGNLLDANRKALDPITGANWEGGLKWAARDGKLNLSISGFRIKKNGIGEPIPGSPFLQLGGYNCCYRIGENQTYKSSGFDLDLTGEVLPGWQVAANFVRNVTTQIGTDFGTRAGQPFLSIQPKSNYKVWMTYDFGAGGAGGSLSGLAVSGGVNGQSSGYQQGSVCVNFAGRPDPVTGYQDCVTPFPPNYVPYSFTVPAYAVFSGRIDYKISNNWSLAVNLENIFDKTYYQTVGQGVGSGHWYGAPRSVTASIRAKW
jgi:outer-membrane receptor for ferric coprogen and ferric-rhodotorulic acid